VYVLDLDPGDVNRELVEVEALDPGDEAFLRDVVTRHQEETGSTVAAALLDDWPSALARLAKIMPRDYKRVLAAAALAELDGTDLHPSIMEATRG